MVLQSSVVAYSAEACVLEFRLRLVDRSIAQCCVIFERLSLK